MSDAACEAAPATPGEGETVWVYECYVPILHGSVFAPRGDDDAAMRAAIDDAHGKYGDAIDSGTWHLREVSP